MKKKAIKIAASTAVAASAFVAAAPAQQADAATNVNQLVTDAQNAGTVLKWAISVEGSANYVTRPYDQYNAAKKAIAAAEAAAKKASASEKLSIAAKLVEPKLQVKRAQAYIDAITSSEKIKELTAALEAAIKTNDIEKVEAAYHTATAEYRKQAKLLDRVYGQSTRDGIRNAVKPAIEKLVADVKNDVTVSMLAKAAAADIKAGKLVDAAKKLADAQAILDANVLKWETSLQKSVDDVATSLPLTVLSATRVNDNTVEVKLNKAVTAIESSEFTFDNGLAVTSATLAKDGKTVTLSTTKQEAGKTYTLTYKGTKVSFTTPASSVISNVAVDGSAVRSELGKNVPLVASFKQTNGQPSQSTVNVLVPANLTAVSIQGTTPSSVGSETIDGVVYTVYAATPNTSGQVSVVVSAGNAATTQTGKVEFRKMFNGQAEESKKTGTLYFYEVPASASLVDAELTFVDAANNYFVANNKKYLIKTGDTLFNESSLPLTVDSFKTFLNIGDKVTGTYNKTTASDLRIVFNKVVSDLEFSEKFFVTGKENSTDSFRTDDDTIALEGLGNAGYDLHVYKIVGTSRVFLGKTTVSSNGTWSYVTNVDQNTITKFEAVQKPVGVAVETTDVGEFLNVTEGAFSIGVITNTATSNDSVLMGDTVVFNSKPLFNGVVDSTKVANNATITVVDGDGTKATFTNNTNLTKFTAGTTGFNVTFGYVEGAAGGDNKLSGVLTVIDVKGVTNAYGVKFTPEADDKIVNY